MAKDPKDRISASESLKHAAFTFIQGKLPGVESENVAAENTTVHNLKDFHEKYKFDIKQFPKTKANIPDSIHDLNTPMIAPDDKRMIKQMNPAQSGMTPQLQGRTLAPDAKQMVIGKSGLNEIKEENDANKAAIKKNLKSWI